MNLLTAAARLCGELTKLLKEYMFRGNKQLKPVVPDADDASVRIVQLSPDVVSTVDLAGLPPAVREAASKLIADNGGRCVHVCTCVRMCVPRSQVSPPSFVPSHRARIFSRSAFRSVNSPAVPPRG